MDNENAKTFLRFELERKQRAIGKHKVVIQKLRNETEMIKAIMEGNIKND